MSKRGRPITVGEMTPSERAAYMRGYRAGRASMRPDKPKIDRSRPPAELWKQDNAEWSRRYQRWRYGKKKAEASEQCPD